MKNLFYSIAFLAIVITLGCVKDKGADIPDYDCYESYTSYSENGEYINHQKSYYKNGLIAKIEQASGDIWIFNYDANGNLIKFESDNGGYFLYEYDSKNRCINSEQYVENTLYLETLKFYSDTLLIKETFINSLNDTLGNSFYYYSVDNKIDSVISYQSKIYHYYTINTHSVIKFNNNNHKYFESTTTYGNGINSKYEELYFNDNGDLYRSSTETKEYDENMNLVKRIFEQFDINSGNQYEEVRYSYNTLGEKQKSETYDVNGNLTEYTEFIYEGSNLVKMQLFDSNNNKIGYTIVENSCNK